MPWSDAVYKLVMIVLCVAVGLIFLFAIVVPYANKYLNLDDLFPGQNPESVDFENAMKCAYYRCTKGCDSNEVKSLTATWSDPQTHNDVSCADFCKAGQTICNVDSNNNPIRIDIGEKAYISQDKLNPIFGTDCIMSPDYQNLLLLQGINWMDVIQDSVVLEYSAIYSFFSTFSSPVNAKFVSITSSSSVDSGQAQYQMVDCYVAGQKIGKNAYSSANILPGKYQISMYHGDFVNHALEFIYIAPYQKTSSSTNTHSSTQVASCAAQGGNCKTVCSNVELDLGILNCRQGTQTVGRTCCK